MTAWTFLLEATPVSHSVPLDSEKDQTIPVTSGLTSETESEGWLPGFASSRMSKDISLSDSERLLQNWKSLVIKRRGEYSARLNAARLIRESECLSWPSPVASEVRQGFQDRSRGMKGSQESLTTVVIKDGLAAQGNHSTHGSRPESWATPRAEMDSGAHRGKPDTLHSQIKVWATPEGMAGGKTSRGGNRKGELLLTGQVKQDASGKLNPRWVETLMGLPVGWTMPSCSQPIVDPANAVMMSSAGSVEDTTQTAHALDQIAVMTDNRTDELRLLGNGVVPATAEKAFRTLINDLHKDRRTAGTPVHLGGQPAHP